MNKSMLIGIAIGAGVATTGGVIAGYQVLGRSAQDAPGSAVVTEADEHVMDHGAGHAPVEPSAAPPPAPARQQTAVTPAPVRAPAPQVVSTQQAAPIAQEECWDETVEVPNEPRDEKRIAGTAVGALVGGAIAKDLGDRDLTTAVGAAAGAVIGRKLQGRIQENRATTTTVVERRCGPAGSR